MVVGAIGYFTGSLVLGVINGSYLAIHHSFKVQQYVTGNFDMKFGQKEGESGNDFLNMLAKAWANKPELQDPEQSGGSRDHESRPEIEVQESVVVEITAD
jgi:hypothetical protein